MSAHFDKFSENLNCAALLYTPAILEIVTGQKNAATSRKNVCSRLRHSANNECNEQEEETTSPKNTFKQNQQNTQLFHKIASAHNLEYSV